MKRAIPLAFFAFASLLFGESQQPPFEEKNWETNENFRNVFLELDALRSNISGGTDISPNTVTAATVTATNITATTISASSVTVTNFVTAGWLAAPYPMLIVVDQKAQNTDGGTFTNAAWRTRTLNTVSTNTINGASVTGSTITLPSGTYYASWSAPAFFVDSHQTVFTSTDSVVVSTGTTAYTNSSVFFATESFGSVVFAITSPKDFILTHRCQTTRATDGFGNAANFTTEVYSRVEIWKLR